MDDFYQTLRKIQKYERTNGDLAKLDETFYNDLYDSLKESKQQSEYDSSSKSQTFNEHFRSIGIEVCERREKKINEMALLNFHRQYTIFLEESETDSIAVTPQNLTFSEKKLYSSLINLFKQYREELISNDYNPDNFNIELSNQLNEDIWKKLSKNCVDDIERTNAELIETSHDCSSLVNNLEKIVKLYENGFLTDDEFILMKQKLFGKK